MNNNTESFIKGLVLGTVAGAAAGILFAPKSGAETREDIKHLAEDIKEKATDAYSKARKEVEKKVAAVKRAGKMIDEGKYKSIVNEVVEEFKQDAEVTSSAAKKLGEQLRGDWAMVKKQISE